MEDIKIIDSDRAWAPRNDAIACDEGSFIRCVVMQARGKLLRAGSSVRALAGDRLCGRLKQLTADLHAVMLAFPIGYNYLAAMLLDRGVEVDHTTLFRWVQTYAAKLEQRVRRHLRLRTGSWRVDETHIKVKGVWTYLYRAVDSLGQTIDFRLSARRNADAARRFFRKALARPHVVNPSTITVDKNPAYPRATRDMKRAGQLWRFLWLRQCRYLNNIVEQDHCRIKRLVRLGLGFGSLHTARRTLAGYEAMAIIRKRQVHHIGDRDMPAQATFIARLFEVAA